MFSQGRDFSPLKTLIIFLPARLAKGMLYTWEVCALIPSLWPVLIDGFPAIFLREMVFKGKEFGEEDKKERTNICEFCQMMSIPLRALENHQPSSHPAMAVQRSCISRPAVLHQLSVQRSCISCPVALHWPSSNPTSAV